jgi:DNA-binding MurR/RpiR family transcriptional regulator
MITSSDSYNRILENYDSLPKQQKKIADYIISHYDEVIFFSITKLAASLEVSEATIVRFAQNLGHKGYPELKEDLTKYYKEYLTHGQRMKRSIEEFPDDPMLFKAHVQKEMELLEQSVQALDNDIFIKAVDKIIAADRIHIFGNGGNACLANHLNFRLARFKFKTHQHSVAGKNIIEKLIHIEKKDLVIAFHFYKPTVDFSMLMEVCYAKGIPVLLVTDSLVPPVIRRADLVLLAPRGSIGTFHSQVVPIAINNALINGVASKMGDKAVEALQELTDLRRKYYFSSFSSSDGI